MLRRVLPLVSTAALFAAGGGAMTAERLLGIAVSEHPQRSCDEGVAIAAKVGARYASIPLQWDEIETSPGVYAPDTDWLAIASVVYPSLGWKVALELNPIDTIADRRPGWLRGKAWDDPEVIAAYRAMVREVMTRTRAIDLVSFAAGNEIDALLGADDVQWAGYAALVAAARDEVHALRKDVPVGTKVTFGALSGDAREEIAALIENTDAAMVTWYPVDAAFRARDPELSAAADLALMVDALAGRTIHLTEVGYPSSASCAGGEAAQARFVRAFFAGWDRHADHITHAYWTWMTDVSDEVVKQARDYYGVAEPCFAEYIGTLGLETKDLKPKAGWTAFAEEAAKRFH